jgi:molybdopterin converting factor small subunit
MVKINVTTLSHYTDGQQVVEVNGSTVGQCLDHLVKQFPSIKPYLFDKDGKLHSDIDIYANGRSIYPEELAKMVNDGDELDITFLIGGG